MKIFLVTLSVAMGVTLTVAADVLLKKSGWHDWRFIALGIIMYGLVAVPVAFAFKYTEFGKLFLIWESLAVILGMIVSALYYKEPFTIYRLIALVLALGALYFSYK